ncbi:hypothetical protein ACH3O9_08945 [Leeuwenhoekiella sp. A16]|uniref:hypothetical protein n=1 Tax=unclassified Leeuwenhoekiella TaxID=2615029 RepID=UPI003A80BA10
MSCKNEDEKRIDGEFIYTDEAAVIKGDSFIYGVKQDEMAKKLVHQTAGYKNSDYDMVPVIVKAVITPKPAGQQGWDSIVAIKEIIAVMHPKKDQGVEVEYKKED